MFVKMSKQCVLVMLTGFEQGVVKRCCTDNTSYGHARAAAMSFATATPVQQQL